ncbi:MAG: SusC/RagA family TonB-linked outer membrane protein, partial [Bacteroidota bacterium]
MKKFVGKLWMMSKFFAYMAFLQAIFLTSAMAHSAHSQSLKETYVNFNWEKAQLDDVFKNVQLQTDFFFSYDRSVIEKISVSGSNNNMLLSDFLYFLSGKTGLQFSISMENIYVYKGEFTSQRKVQIEVPPVESMQKMLKQLQSEVIFETVFNEMSIDKIVKGKVMDKNGQPLIGATVQTKNTRIGTVTDADGSFSLVVPDEEAAVLVISYIGYTTQEIVINGDRELTIVLAEDSEQLEEIVVVGYGQQQRSDVDGAVTSIDPATINNFPATSVEQSLVGNVPGVHLVQSSGAPGAGISLRVRGVTSIAGGNEPLYVIDGVPFFNNDVRGLNGLSTINPNDIESVEILKDAAATAIYGSRGGNGVVLITTKSGKSQASSVNYNAWFSVEEPITEIDVMNAAEFTEYAERWSANSGQPIPDQDLIFQGANTDWQDEIMGNAFSQNHNLNFSGGNDFNRFYFALGYLNQDGVVTNTNFERFSLRANMNNFLNDVVSIQTSIFGNHSVQNGVVPAQNNNTFSISKTAIGSSLWSLPTIPVRNAEGEFSAINDFVENPVLYVNEVRDRSTVDRWLASTTVKLNILNGLTNNTRLGFDFTNIKKDIYFPRSFRIILGGDGAAIAENTETLNYVVENFLEYKNKVTDNLLLDGILGASIQRERTNFSNLEGSGFISDDLENNAIQAAQNTAIPITSITERSIASVFGRLRFILNDKYILAASIRRDGASVFSENNKVATFPSISFAWKLHEEPFLNDISQITSFKLRASWGESGNPAIQPYQSLPLGLLTTTSQGAGTGLAVGLAPNLPNQNLTWETTAQTNVGLDFGLFDDRITGTLDYYLKQTDGALSTVQLAPSAGFNTIIDNVGEVENRGFEFSLNTLLIDPSSSPTLMALKILPPPL